MYLGGYIGFMLIDFVIINCVHFLLYVQMFCSYILLCCQNVFYIIEFIKLVCSYVLLIMFVCCAGQCQHLALPQCVVFIRGFRPMYQN